MATAYQNTYGLNTRSNLYDKWITPTLQSPSYSITPLAKSPSLYTYSEAQPKSGDNKLSANQIISTVKREMAADDKFVSGHIPAKYNSYLSGVISNSEVSKAEYNHKTESTSDLSKYRKERIDEELGHYGSMSHINETASIKPNSRSVISASNILKNTVKNEHELDFKLGVDSPYAIQRDWRTTHAQNESPYSLSPMKKQYLGSSISDKARLPETDLGELPFERSHSTISALRSNVPDQNAVAGRIRELGITSLGLKRANTFHGTPGHSGTALNSSVKSQHDSVTSPAKTMPNSTHIDNQDCPNTVDSKKVFDNVDAILKRQQDITKATNLSSLESKYKMADTETEGTAATLSAPWHVNHDTATSKSNYLTAYDKQPLNYNSKSSNLTAYDKQPVHYSAASRLDTADLARAKLSRTTSAHIGSDSITNDYLRSKDAKPWKPQDYMFQLNARDNQRVDSSKLNDTLHKSKASDIDQYSSNGSHLTEDIYNKYRYNNNVGKDLTSSEHKSSYVGNMKSVSLLDKPDYQYDSCASSNKRDSAFGVATSNNTRNDVLSCLSSTVSSGGLDRVSNVKHISPRYDTVQPTPFACRISDFGKRGAPKSILKKTSAYDVERNRDYLDIIHATGPSQFPALDGTLRRKLRKRVTFDSALHYSEAIGSY